MRRGIQGAEPGVVHDVMPRWLAAGGASYIAFALAVASFHGVSDHGGWARPGLAATCLALAVLPWAVTLVRPTPSFAWIGLTLVALSVLQLGGAEWDWMAPGHEGMEQTSFLLSCWLAVDVAVARRGVQAAVTTACIAATMVAHGAIAGFATTPIWLTGLAYAYLGGLVLRTLALTIVRLRAAEGRLADEAVAAEQRRIAREVHDVVAHTLAVTSLQLSAARMASDRGDLAATREALTDAEALNRSSLGDLRRIVRLLRAPDDRPTGVEAALPGLDQLGDVVAASRAAGLAVDLTVDGDTRRVDDATGLVVLRVAQEALTNALRHQDGPTAVVSVSVGDAVDVAVRSTGPRRPAGPPGVGLVGMEERVAAAGGDLHVGPTDDGWVVRVRLPVAAPPTAGPSAPAASPSVGSAPAPATP